MSDYAFPQTPDARSACPSCSFKMIPTHSHSTCHNCGTRFQVPSQLELVLSAFSQMRSALETMSHKFDELIEAHRKAHEPAPRD